MRIIKTSFLALFILCFTVSNTFAFRCGSDLVSNGDTKAKVKITCGKPTSTEKSCEGRQAATHTDKKGKTVKSKKCASKVDIWYYNCGDNDFIYALTFENGKLSKEDNIGQGKGKSDCLGK